MDVRRTSGERDARVRDRFHALDPSEVSSFTAQQTKDVISCPSHPGCVCMAEDSKPFRNMGMAVNFAETAATNPALRTAMVLRKRKVRREAYMVKWREARARQLLGASMAGC